MKEVLVVDAVHIFQQFISEKLTAEKINVEFSESRRDGFVKLLNQMPDLVIFDLDEDGGNDILFEFLEKKQTNPNTIKIPVIVMGPDQGREKVALMAKYNVIKYFSKPIKYDVLFEAVSNVLRMPIPLDSTPCVLDVHLNDNIIFVELAQGLNREKMALLKFRLGEIIDDNELSNPKVVVMLSGLDLSFVDGYNLEVLFDNIIADKRIRNQNVKILSMDQFAKDLIEGHPQYSGFEVVENLSKIMSSLVDSSDGSSLPESIANNILKTDRDFDAGTVEMRFASDGETEDSQGQSESGSPSANFSGMQSGAAGGKPGVNLRVPLKVAVVDDDPVVCAKLSGAFLDIGAECDIYNNGIAFLNALGSKRYNLLSLDINMPKFNGFEVLSQLMMKRINLPTIVYSQIIQREYIMQALSLGAKAYVLKQQPPEAVVQKAIELYSL